MGEPRKQTAMVAMSGGVDSSVAALLAVESGFEAAGVTCKMAGRRVLGEDSPELDAFLDEVDDAKQVCRALGIPHYVFNYKDVFERCVVQKFVDDYLSGRTPNPCVDCNRHVKFGALQRRREELGYDALVTGHYARTGLDRATGRWCLLRAKHVEKDQSYMLCQLTQNQLAHSVFPLGGLSKDEVRALAANAGFASARKRESQDICFVPDGDYAAFIDRWVAAGGSEVSDPNTPAAAGSEPSAEADGASPGGPIVDASGTVLGRHDGLYRYTVGQRKGIGIAVGEPLYVIAKDAAENALVVGPRGELTTREAAGTDVNFVSLAPEDAEGRSMRVLAKTSYRQQPRSAVATFANGTVQLEFDEPVVRPAPGQALALYDAETGDSVLVGATLSE